MYEDFPDTASEPLVPWRERIWRFETWVGEDGVEIVMEGTASVKMAGSGERVCEA